MNDISLAMKAAGIKVPVQKERIWRLLKDEGDMTVTRIASKLAMPEPSTQAAITDMQQRKMVGRKERKSAQGVRLNNEYFAIGKTYELLPRVKAGAAGRAVANKKPTETVAAAPLAEFNVDAFIAPLTLGQAKAVMLKLKRMFA